MHSSGHYFKINPFRMFWDPLCFKLGSWLPCQGLCNYYVWLTVHYPSRMIYYATLLYILSHLIISILLRSNCMSHDMFMYICLSFLSEWGLVILDRVVRVQCSMWAGLAATDTQLHQSSTTQWRSLLWWPTIPKSHLHHSLSRWRLTSVTTSHDTLV